MFLNSIDKKNTLNLNVEVGQLLISYPGDNLSLSFTSSVPHVQIFVVFSKRASSSLILRWTMLERLDLKQRGRQTSLLLWPAQRFANNLRLTKQMPDTLPGHSLTPSMSNVRTFRLCVTLPTHGSSSVSHHTNTMPMLFRFFCMSSVESQKGVIAAQRCSVENQKGAIAVQSQWQ